LPRFQQLARKIEKKGLDKIFSVGATDVSSRRDSV